MQIAIIVLSYNGVRDTLACLESLELSGYLDSVIIVDNASSDGSVKALSEKYPRTPLLALPTNLGWAGGNNFGIKYALENGADYICLLNNDTIVSPTAIDELIRASQLYGQSLMHPVIDFFDGRDGAQLDPRNDGGHYSPATAGKDDGIYELSFTYGACLLVPAETFNSIGLFDERFFLQLEETDFGIRAKRRGIRSLCTTHARIRHKESQSFGGSRTPLKTYYIVRNTLLLIEKHHKRPDKALREIRNLIWSIASSGVAPRAWFHSRNPFIVASRAAVKDYILRRFGCINPSSARLLEDLEAIRDSSSRV